MIPKAFKKSNKGKRNRPCLKGTAAQAIGTLEKDTDTFILTYGQFSLIDALMAILDQTGPAHIIISTWTAAHADLTRSAELLETAEILSFKMIVDRSFQSRQPEYYQHMLRLFSPKSVRAVRTHAKFLTVRNDKWNIVVRTSMNLNSNPRLENLEVSENKEFADFFEQIADDIFSEVEVGKMHSDKLQLKNILEHDLFTEIEAQPIKRNTLKEATYTHEIQH